MLTEDELGKVKYYPDKGKLKAKDMAGNERAASKDVGKLSGGLAPFIIKDLNQDQRNYLMLLIFAMGK